MNIQKIIIRFFILSCIPLFLSACLVTRMGVLQSANIDSLLPSTVPFEIHYGLLFIPVKIQGKTYHFLFDTGFQTSAISKGLADQLGLKTAGKINVFDSQSTKRKQPISELDKLTIGDVHYSDIGLFITDFNKNPLFSCIHIDGVVGINIIRQTNWNINYDNQTFTITKKSSTFSPKNRIPLPFEEQKGMPRVKLFLNNQSEKFLVDIGYNGETPSVADKKIVHPVIQKSIGYSSFGLFNQTKLDTTIYARLAISDSLNFHLDSIFVNFSNHNTPLIGNGFFMKFYSSIYFDFGKNILYLKPRKKINKNVYNYPFAPKLLNKKIVVGLVNSKFSQFTIGDSILAINHLDIQHHSMCELINEYWTTKTNKKPIQIRIQLKSGEEKTFTLPIESITSDKKQFPK